MAERMWTQAWFVCVCSFTPIEPEPYPVIQYTRLPIRYVVCWTGKDQRNIVERSNGGMKMKTRKKTEIKNKSKPKNCTRYFVGTTQRRAGD